MYIGSTVSNNYYYVHSLYNVFLKYVDYKLITYSNI